MALKATIYKADLQLADMDRHVYGDHALTLALHPSETVERMMVRVLAYALHAQEGIAFTRGLSEVDEPDIWVKNLAGEITLWIDLGQPDEARIRRACSRADEVVVLCYAANCDVWWKQIAGRLTRFANLTVLQLPADTAQALGALAERSMRLQCLVQDGDVWMNTDTRSVRVKLTRLQSPA
ncbi:MAG: YaeQ family protein [Thiobacillus sp.]